MSSSIVSRARSRLSSRVPGARLALAGALACLSSLACSAQADIPEVIVTQTDVAFEGVPRVPGAPLEHEISTSFDHPSDVTLPSELNPELHPLAASISGRGQSPDLSFVHGIRLTLASRAEGAPAPIVLAEYEREGSATATSSIELDIDRSSNVLEYWDTKDAYYDVTIRGELPEQTWSIDVSFAFSGRLSVSAN